MSLLAAAFALAAQPEAVPPEAESPVDAEITVIGNRLRGWRATWRTRGSAVSCKTSRSTGDKAIDAIGCDALVQCIAPLAPQLSALDDARLPRAEKDRQGTAILETAKVFDCIFARREAGIATLAAARTAARAKAGGTR